jgi:hypothetical protein
MFKGRRLGGGPHYINEIINHLKLTVAREMGEKTIDQFLNNENRQAVDFWLEDEQTIMEIEFNIFSSPPILERTIFKALLAQDAGKDVRKLIVIADSGSGVLLKAPIPQSIINWVCKKYKISILIWELTDIDESLIRN